MASSLQFSKYSTVAAVKKNDNFQFIINYRKKDGSDLAMYALSIAYVVPIVYFVYEERAHT